MRNSWQLWVQGADQKALDADRDWETTDIDLL